MATKKLTQSDRKALLTLGAKRFREAADKIAEWERNALTEEIEKISAETQPDYSTQIISIEMRVKEYNAIIRDLRKAATKLDGAVTTLREQVEADGLSVGYVTTTHVKDTYSTHADPGRGRGTAYCYGRLYQVRTYGVRASGNPLRRVSETHSEIKDYPVELKFFPSNVVEMVHSAVSERRKAEKIPTFEQLDKAWSKFEDEVTMAMLTGDGVADLLKLVPEVPGA